MKIVGVDVGGTKIAAGLVDGDKIIRQTQVPTPNDRPQTEVVNAVIQAIEEVYDSGVKGIGIGVPGLVDLKEQRVIDVVNIPSWDSVPLAEMISDYFNKPVFVNNDANCFALGEKYFGKGKPYANFVGLTLGTGLGAGIVINNHLYSGRFCGAGEFGCFYYKDQTIEAYASGQFLKDMGIDGKLLYKRASLGDPVALKLFETLGLHIGHAVANILFALAPEAIIFGGSVSKSYKYFSDSMLEFLEDNFPYRRLYNQLAIEVSDTEESGIYGASSLV
ncbi:MAG TPA: ROK family protein, partial [Prolixibacteraceae bacterium]|nr:ROK family protein [Prolixibacteraceae bacterium]